MGGRQTRLVHSDLDTRFSEKPSAYVLPDRWNISPLGENRGARRMALMRLQMHDARSSRFYGLAIRGRPVALKARGRKDSSAQGLARTLTKIFDAAEGRAGHEEWCQHLG